MGFRRSIKSKVKGVLRRVVDQVVTKDTTPPESKPYETKKTTTKAHSPEPKQKDKKPEPQPASTTAVVEKPTETQEKVAAAEAKPVAPESSVVEDKQTVESAAKEETVEPPPTTEEPIVEQPGGLQEHPVSPDLNQELSEEEKKQLAEEKHLRKTRKGLLKKIKEQGGELSLKDLHAYSEKRFFVGHQRFSVLMESMVTMGRMVL